MLDTLPYLTENLTQAPEQLLQGLLETTLAVRLQPDSNDITLAIRLPVDDLHHMAKRQKWGRPAAQRAGPRAGS